MEKADIVSKWESSAWAKKRAASAKRRTLTDFERFQVVVHKKARRDKVRKVLNASKEKPSKAKPSKAKGSKA